MAPKMQFLLCVHFVFIKCCHSFSRISTDTTLIHQNNNIAHITSTPIDPVFSTNVDLFGTVQLVTLL